MKQTRSLFEFSCDCQNLADFSLSEYYKAITHTGAKWRVEEQYEQLHDITMTIEIKVTNSLFPSEMIEQLDNILRSHLAKQ